MLLQMLTNEDGSIKDNDKLIEKSIKMKTRKSKIKK